MTARALVNDILNICGLGRGLLLGSPEPALVAALQETGCLVDVLKAQDVGLPQAVAFPSGLTGPWDFIVVFFDPSGDPPDPPLLFRGLKPFLRRHLLLHGSLDAAALLGHTHQAWEEAAVESGYRQSLSAWFPSTYEARNEPRPPLLMAFEPIPEFLLARYPLARLLEERNLHMDHAREASPRADAHLARYALAADWVRDGDTVLDCACGLGYGSALLAARSRGRRFIGVDLSPWAVAYAEAMYGPHGVDFHCASATHLAFLPDASVDCIVSFETLEHVENFKALMAEFHRVLRPDGRIIASVPNLWVDETGRDPNPYHFHVFDWEKLRGAFEGRFLVEARYAQDAPGGVKLAAAPRRLAKVDPFREDCRDTEWWIIVASADPREHCDRIPYSHPAFGDDRPPAKVVAFAEYYRNPWIYRTMVQMGERLVHPAALMALATSLANGDASADAGAALCTLGYQLLAEDRPSDLAALLERIDAYLALPPVSNVHVCRWRISLTYLTALLAMRQGDRAQAEARFKAVGEADPMVFSPLLATKTVLAHLRLGCMKLAESDPAAARKAFQSGCEATRRALHADDLEAIGQPEAPLSFGFQELAEVADLGAQCAMALKWMDRGAWTGGRFWGQVDARRFGLLSWLIAQERELEKQRQPGIHLSAARLVITLLKTYPIPGELVVFGCGVLGRSLVRLLNAEGLGPRCYSDNNPALWGTALDGLPILDPASLFCAGFEGQILIASTTHGASIEAGLCHRFPGLRVEQVLVAVES